MQKQLNKTIVLDARMIVMSGIGRYIQSIVPFLIDNFSHVKILGKSDCLSNFEWCNKVTIIELKATIYSIKEQVEIFLKTPKCDIFISPHYNSPLFLPQAKKIAVVIPDTNHLVFRREFSFAKRIYATLFYKISVNKDIVFTISNFSKGEIVKYTNVKQEKITVAKLSIDKDYFKMLNSQLDINGDFFNISEYANSKFILYIGNIKPHKNLKRALLAFNDVSKSVTDLRFVIVGKKDKFLTGDGEVFKLVKGSQNLSEKVVFTGHLSDLELAYLYKNAQLFLFPSLYEGFGLPPLEAMFFGCPVIVSREGSLPEICGEAALYCNAYDITSIAKAITSVLSDDALRSDLIEKGFSKVGEYDWSYFNKIILDHLIG